MIFILLISSTRAACASYEDGCTYCDLKNKDKCDQCEPKWVLHDGKCIKCDIASCFNCLKDNVCVSCHTGYFQENGVCHRCKEEHLLKQCLECKEG